MPRLRKCLHDTLCTLQARACIICCSRTLQPTPPTISTSLVPTCAMARSVISTCVGHKGGVIPVRLLRLLGNEHGSMAAKLSTSDNESSVCCKPPYQHSKDGFL